MALILVVFQSGPYGHLQAQEGLDVALAAIAFEHRVRVLFVGDGVDLLRRGQNPTLIGQKCYTAGFRSLALHGVQACGVEAQARKDRGLQCEDLLIETEDLEVSQQQQWITDANAIFSF